MFFNFVAKNDDIYAPAGQHTYYCTLQKNGRGQFVLD